MQNARICSIASVLSNDVSYNPDNIIKSTGIRKTRSLTDQHDATDMGIQAAKIITSDTSVMDAFGSNAALVFITQTPRYKTPSSAFVIQEALSSSTKFSLAFDVNLGCSAFPVGLQIASSLLQSEAFDDVLVVIADTLSRFTVGNPAVSHLFSDAASAIHLKRGVCDSVFDHGTDGSGHQAILCEHQGQLKMAGLEVYSFAKSIVPQSLLKVISQLEDNSLPVFLHQANQMINTAIEKDVNKAFSKKVTFPGPLLFPSTLSQYGNTAGSSIPVTICDHYHDKDFRCFAASGFGVGLSWSSVSWTQLSLIKVHPISFFNNASNNNFPAP